LFKAKKCKQMLISLFLLQSTYFLEQINKLVCLN
jgi:hypothetical protein